MTYHLGSVDTDRRAELYGDTRDEEPQPRPRRVLATALALLVMGLFGGGLWFAYVQGTRHALGDAAGASVPLIRADERPTKVKPERPGGMEIPDRDKLIYNPARPAVEHLLPPPEKPLPRPGPPPNPPVQAEQPPATPTNPPASTPANPPAAPPAATTRAQQSAAAAPGKAPQPAQPAPPKTATAAAGGARLQLGSVRSEDDARQECERIKRKNADLLGTLSATPIRADLGEKGVYYRIQTGPVADQAAAERICSELKQRNVGCIINR
jgi:outer membrane biosynthesis protein TonB